MADETETDTRPSGAKELLAQFQKAYSHLITGNQKSETGNRERSLFYRGKARQLRGDRRRSVQAQKYEELADLYEQCAQQNATIHTDLTAGSTAKLEGAMQALTEAEAKIEEITGRKVERSWLTLDEVQLCKQRGFRCVIDDPHVLPFAKVYWKRPAVDRTQDQGN